MVKSNIAEIVRCCQTVGQMFNLRRKPPGSRISTGDQLIDAAALVIEDRTVGLQEDPQQRPLKSLKPSYLARKIAQGHSPLILVREHKMMDLNQVRGETVVTATTAVMTYGKDEENRLKAEWATEGDPSHNRPPRPFYELGRDGERACDAVLDHVADRTIKDLER